MTLKEQYERQQRLTKKITLNEERNRVANLLIEAMNTNDLQQATQIIDKLRSMKGKGLSSLDSAIDAAQTELNKYTGGGVISKAWTKLKSVVGFKNPLVKFMIFANALENGFRLMPQILKNNIEGVDLNAEQTLGELINFDDEKRKTLASNFLKALSPKGIYSALKKVPYVNRESLVNDLFNVPLKNLANVIKTNATGPSTQQIASDLQDYAKQSDATTQPQSPTPTQSSTSTTQNTPGTNTTTSTKTNPTGTPGAPAGKPRELAQAVFDDIRADFDDSGMSENDILKILTTLADNNKLKK